MKAVVTGGAGYLGTKVCEQLAARGVEPIVLDLRPPPAGPQGRAWITGDVYDSEVISQVVEYLQYGPAAVVHLAGLIGTSELFDDVPAAVETNILGTVGMLNACRAAGASFIGIDTGNPQWLSPYAVTKHAAALLALAWRQTFELQATILRVFNIYGPGKLHPSKIVPRFIEAALDRQPIELYAGGGQVVDLIWVDTVAEAFAQAARLSMPVPDPITGTMAQSLPPMVEVGSGDGITVQEFAYDVWNAVWPGETPMVEVLPGRRGEGLHHATADPGPAEQVLGIRITDDDRKVFLARLLETVSWYREQRASRI